MYILRCLDGSVVSPFYDVLKGHTYQLVGQALTIGPAGATRKMCAAPQGIMEQEQAYLASLASVAGYRIQGAQLEWLDAEGAVVATFEAMQGTNE